jgi:tetratricopeptide (TPR) repeat protein
MQMLRKLKLILFSWMAILSLPTALIAGGGPETILVVVNADSALSQRIANEYVSLRNIPQNHMVLLHDIPSMETMSIDTFRNKIWQPVKDYIRTNKLEDEIDVISYSGDFPYAVNFYKDLKAHQMGRDKYRGRIASLTAMTYFAHRVERHNIGYLGKNHYFRDFARPTKKVAPLSDPALVPLNKKEIATLKKKAKQLLREKQTEAAVAIYQQMVEHNPDNALLWYELARKQARVGQNELALNSLASAIDYGWTNSLKTQRDISFQSMLTQERFTNLIQRMEKAYGPFLLTSGFRHHYVWSNPDLTFQEKDDVLDQYYLSTLLAYTGERGNSFPEIQRYLQSAAASDGTQPEGTIYLMENNNVRSTTRQPFFPVTLTELAKRNRVGEILYRDSSQKNTSQKNTSQKNTSQKNTSQQNPAQDGILPIGKNDVMGAVIGFNNYQWQSSGSQILPGAIVESLTSYSGHFHRAKQTKVTEFLRYGAAGSSGAVAEPFSFAEKFPVPMIHAWYADGCSLSEAFYQSIQNPYQMIIVGDPLARPFANFVEISLPASLIQQPWSGKITITPELEPQAAKKIKKIQFWLDGQYLSDVPLQGEYEWDSSTVADGSHELRLIAIEDSAIETRSSKTYRIVVSNHPRQVTIEAKETAISLSDKVILTGIAKGAETIDLMRGYNVLGSTTVKDSRWSIAIPAKRIGPGPVTLYAKAGYANGDVSRSDRINLKIMPDAVMQPDRNTLATIPGLLATVEDTSGKKHVMVLQQLDGKLGTLRKKRLKVKHLTLEGYLQIDETGFYQLNIRGRGSLNLYLNEQPVLTKFLLKKENNVYIPLSLAQGKHKLTMELEVFRQPELKAVLTGDAIPAILSDNRLSHLQTATTEELDDMLNESVPEKIMINPTQTTATGRSDL